MTKEAKRYKVKITVKEITKGKCSREFKPGDSWIYDGKVTPGGMCVQAYENLSSVLRTLSSGGEFTWQNDPDVAVLSCPDTGHWVIYEVRRLRE